MKREIVIKALIDDLGISKSDIELLVNFHNENENVDDYEFYEKLNKTFPLLELTFSHNYVLNLSRIEKHLFFFKVLTIISIIVGVIVTIAVTLD